MTLKEKVHMDDNILKYVEKIDESVFTQYE